MEDGVPRAKLTNSFSFADFASAVPPNGPVDENEKMMWQLAQILFDSQDPELDQHGTDAMRKDHLMKFWKSMVTPIALDQARNARNSEERAIAYLSAHNVWDATECLLSGGDFRLSTMVSQIGGDETMRECVTEQIKHWRSTNILSEIPARIRALYELLAGNTCVSDGRSGAGPENKAETFSISSKFGLDWRRAFGLKLWYGIEQENSISSAVREFTKNLRSHQEQARPIPWFSQQKFEMDWKDPTPQDRQDVLWGLLKIYAEAEETMSDGVNLGDIIAPANVSGNPLDTRLSFQLYHLLAARDIANFEGHDRIHKADMLASDLAYQLSASQMPFSLVSISQTPPRAAQQFEHSSIGMQAPLGKTSPPALFFPLSPTTSKYPKLGSGAPKRSTQTLSSVTMRPNFAVFFTRES